MSKTAVMLKRGLSEPQYRAFARSVGFKIDYNRKLGLLAKHYDVSLDEIPHTIAEDLLSLSTSPSRLIIQYCDLIGIEDTTPHGVIADEIYLTTEESFCRFGDRNYLTPSIESNYLATHGQPLDVQLQSMNETHGIEIYIDDLIDFIVTYPNGPHYYVSEIDLEKQSISADFFDVVGFHLTDRFAMTFKSEHAYGKREVYENMPF